jgi:hypothetical protein
VPFLCALNMAAVAMPEVDIPVLLAGIPLDARSAIPWVTYSGGIPETEKLYPPANLATTTRHLPGQQ